MTPLIDQVCLAAGKQGAVMINHRCISIYCPVNRLDFESFEVKCQWGEAIHELARRQAHRDSL